MQVPRFQRVFWCLHLRRGCILLVYLNLLICALAVLAFGFLDFMKTFLRLFLQDWYTGLHRAFRSKVHAYLVAPLLLADLLLELAMAVVALVGLHKKRLDLLKVTLYFNVLVSAFMFLFRMFDVGHYSWRAELFAAVVYAGSPPRQKRLELLKVTLYFNVLVSAFMFLFRMFDVGHYSWRAELFAAVVYAAYKCYYILCIRSVVKKWMESDKKSVDTALESGREELELGLPAEEVFDETT